MRCVEYVMLRSSVIPLLTSLLAGAAAAQPMPMQSGPYPMPRVVVVAPPQSQQRLNLGGGFVEFLFGDHQQAPVVSLPTPRFDINPRYLRQEVEYRGEEAPGTIVIDTPNKFLYLVESGRKAMRYGIGVGRPGFAWSGEHKITAKKEWPDWVPPQEMLERQPYLPHFMPGGPGNPLGARALYLGSTLYRIHGTTEDWTIGTNVSSGCIRLRNADVEDLYNRVKVGTKVVVM